MGLLDSIAPTPRGKILGLLADAVQGANDFASAPFGYDNPPARAILGLLGVPAVANTLNEMSYGGALGTGKGMTWKPKADTIDAAMVAAPLAMSAPAAINKTAAAVGKAVAPAVERAVPAIMERGGLPAQFLQDMSQQTVSPLTVWHGSPHKFDKFDASKIGTGEGAQAYGHGLYVAESPTVADSYAKELGDLEILHNGKTVGVFDKDPAANAAHQIRATGGDIDKAIKRAQSLYTGSWRDNVVSEIQKLGPGDVTENVAGNLYKIDLPDEHIAKMLDWDKPLSEQHPDVQAALKNAGIVDFDKNIGPSAAGEIRDLGWTKNVGSLGGEDLYRRLVERQFMQKGSVDTAARKASEGEVSDFLRNQGIPGIRYLDGGSRGTGAGTSNFVIFPGNEGMLKILERNGQPMGLLGGN